MGRKKRGTGPDARGYATVSVAKASQRPLPQPQRPAGVLLDSAATVPEMGTARSEQPQQQSALQALSPEQLRIAVGRQRQRLLGLLQDYKPSVKKVSHALQKLAQYRAEYTEQSAADWLGAVYANGAVAQVDGALCVGCGDGSYEMGVLIAGARDLTVTFYESEARLRQRYTNFGVNTLVLRFLGARLLFEVDATALGPSLLRARTIAPLDFAVNKSCRGSNTGTGCYSQVLFNFPQTGNGFPGSERWMADHATLLRAYFRSAAGVSGEVSITLMDREPYSALPIDCWATGTLFGNTIVLYVIGNR